MRGLSIGLAASILILQYVKDELSYDDFHEKRANIYRVQFDAYRDGEGSRSKKVLRYE